MKWKVQDLELDQRKSEFVEKDCQTRQLCKEDAVYHRKWRKLNTDVV